MKNRNAELTPRNGDTLVVGVVARISGRPSQKEQSLADQEAHAKEVVLEMFDGPVEYRIVSTVNKGEILNRPELEKIEAMLRTRELDLLFAEDIGRIVRGVEAARLVGIAKDHGVRVIAPNDCIDTNNANWEQDTIRACEKHVAHNAHTSKRIKQKQMNRFLEHGGSIPREIYGYNVPDFAKLYSEWSKEPAAIPIYTEWFEMLMGGALYTEVARWLNKKGIRPGPYARKKIWDGKMVASVTKNAILKGKAERGHRHTEKHYGTGRRNSVKNTEGPRWRDFPHLAHVEPAVWDEVNAMLKVRNAGFGRKAVKGRDPRAGVAKSSTVWPAQHVVCGICGRQFYRYGHGQKGHLVCSGMLDHKCWNGASFNGEAGGKKILAALLLSIESLPGFEPTLKAKLEAAAAASNSAREAQRKEASVTLATIKRSIDNFTEAIGQMGSSRAINEKLAVAEQEKAKLERQLQQLSVIRTEPLELPSIEDVKASARDLLGTPDFADDRFRRIMRLLLPKIEVYPCQLIDGGGIRLRAKLTIQLTPLAPEHHALELLPTMEVMVDLFDLPQRAAFGAKVVEMRAKDMTEKAVAKQLGLTVTAAQRAKTLHDRAIAEGQIDLYIYLKKPLDKCRKNACHLNESYKFEPLPGYPTGPCAPDTA